MSPAVAHGMCIDFLCSGFAIFSVLAALFVSFALRVWRAQHTIALRADCNCESDELLPVVFGEALIVQNAWWRQLSSFRRGSIVMVVKSASAIAS